MNTIKDFFSIIGFDFKKSLKKSKYIYFEDNVELNKKVESSFFFYENPNQTNTSFYLIATQLSESELETVRKFVWNESRADLIFYTVTSANANTLFEEDFILNLHYAKASPKNAIEESRIDSFNILSKDLEKINNINRWQFDSGAFWLSYHSFLKKVSQRGIDKELVITLKTLKDELHLKLKKIEKDSKIREEVVQAIIDRTLYIKYLEDSHIINSYFYSHYFANENTTYKALLFQSKVEELNRLFKIIHTIFNNNLFDKPNIKDEYLNKDVCDLLYASFNTNLKTKQTRLFDFQFDVIPVEFISYIYEIFLSDKQKENGIYYTPKKLAQLILDDIILDNKIGTVLDPSCGSGMFLIVAFQKLLENSKNKKFKTIAHEIEFRIKLLSENIFGIEKEITAQRFTIFSLSLQLFRGLDPIEIKKYIASQLEQNKEVELFKKHSFFENILCNNSLRQDARPFENMTFDYIVGNPPFFEIKRTDDEITFIDTYEIKINETAIKASSIVGKHQISQCFLIKIKDWSNENTRFGFVSNSSNFYNDNSNRFQDFFYTSYNLEKVYELSKVKKILFENAKESVVALIFDNQSHKKNAFEYYPVDMALFSEKPFESLVIKEDKCIDIEQNELITGDLRLRDFLIGNKFDRSLLLQLSKYKKLKDYLNILGGTKDFVNNGLQIVGKEQLVTEFNITENEWNALSKSEKIVLSEKFKTRYTRKNKSRLYDTPLISPKNLMNFSMTQADVYLGNISNFQRTRSEEIYSEPKIIINRTGKQLKAAYIKEKIYYNFDIYSIFLKENKLNYLITAVINSSLINYFVDLLYRKRSDGSFPKIGYDAIKNIPIPNELDVLLVRQISKISEDLTEGKYSYTNPIARKLDDLIFDLYDLNYIERQRIRDFFKPIAKTIDIKNELEKYRSMLIDTISMYFKNDINIDFTNASFNLIVAKVSFNELENPIAKKVKNYILNEIFEQNPKENFLASQEKIYGKNCVYIVRKKEISSWSETKAYEDGQEILKNIH